MSRPQRKYQLVVGSSSSARGGAAVHTGDDDMTSVSDLSHPSRQDVSLPPNIQAAIALTLTFKENITASVQFDYCDIAACGVQDLRFWRSDQYLCSTTNRCGPGVRFVKETTFQDLISPHPHVARRAKRSTSPAGSFDSHVYLDAIGVPRGVPDEFKARNQIASGIESFFFWWVTINKNVDWINYIYYNQQRFINFTRDAITGLHEQLDKTSLMAWQNRMALDMILAEKGGVCRMFGSACCTFIPNNTAPGGLVTRTQAPLTA
uniref:Uncharacterized protein n=1 Tax=Gasterosteus aculeatus aculeatus TaxID=481459 RepID=A0AAQ4PTE2_GASAC